MCEGKGKRLSGVPAGVGCVMGVRHWCAGCEWLLLGKVLLATLDVESA